MNMTMIKLMSIDRLVTNRFVLLFILKTCFIPSLSRNHSTIALSTPETTGVKDVTIKSLSKKYNA